MTFGDYVRLLRTYWRSILLVTAIGAGASIGVTATMTQTYTATAGVLFTPVSTSDSGQDLAFAAQYTQSRMVVYQGLVDTPQVLGVVVSGLDLTITPLKLADDVSARFDPSSTLLTVEVEDESAVQAAKISRAVSQSLIATVGQFETQADPSAKPGEPQTVERVSGKLVSDPAVPTSPTSPDLQLNLAAGILLGLILGFAQAGIRFARAGFAPPPPRAGLLRRKAKPEPAEAVAEPVAAPEPAAVAEPAAAVTDTWSPQAPVLPPAPLSPPKLTETETQTPVPPRATKPKRQKRPGRRTRRA